MKGKKRVAGNVVFHKIYSSLNRNQRDSRGACRREGALRVDVTLKKPP